MRSFRNHNPENLHSLRRILREGKEREVSIALAGGGSDLLGQIKDDLVSPDWLVNLKRIRGLDQIRRGGRRLRLGALVTLDQVSRHPRLRARYRVLAEAAGSVATPQIRNVATLAGNVCQRPWCWYYRQGFPCFKNGGDLCYSVVGDNRFNAIFGGGPSYIVHPSDTAPALVALEARFQIRGSAGERTLAASDFFALPEKDVNRENVLEPDEVLTEIQLGQPRYNRSSYTKIMDREAWTHAVVSAAVALDLDSTVCRRARIVLGGVAPVPWTLPAVDELLRNRKLTPQLAAKAGELAVRGAQPLSGNGYKIKLTANLVRRSLLSFLEPSDGST